MACGSGRRARPVTSSLTMFCLVGHVFSRRLRCSLCLSSASGALSPCSRVACVAQRSVLRKLGVAPALAVRRNRGWARQDQGRVPPSSYRALLRAQFEITARAAHCWQGERDAI